MARGVRRDKTKEIFWRRMLRGQAGSGLSVRAWCRKHNLHEHGFYWWRVRLARSGRGGKVRSTKPTFVPVRVSAPGVSGTEGQIEIALSGDRCIRVHGPVDRQMLADVLVVLEAPLC
jgi:transposase-like protein